jgi:predicted RNase H-like nuclease (RuvC/YqgF family)
METPTSIHELVNRLVELENQVQRLQRENKALKNMNENGRAKAVLLSVKTTKQSTFSNYEVKQHARDISDALTKKPLTR